MSFRGNKWEINDEVSVLSIIMLKGSVKVNIKKKKLRLGEWILKIELQYDPAIPLWGI